jgi:hypothetical protein
MVKLQFGVAEAIVNGKYENKYMRPQAKLPGSAMGGEDVAAVVMGINSVWRMYGIRRTHEVDSQMSSSTPGSIEAMLAETQLPRAA